MIDCPICHVRNNDDARFCAECGQRLGGPAQPAPSPPASVQPTVAPAMPAASSQNPAPAAPAPAQPAEPKISAARPKLRSPLLEEFDDDGYEETVEPPEQHAPRGGALKSPLLGGGTSSGSGLHSPLLDRSGGGNAARNSRPPADHSHDEGHHHSGLRSPLLGGAAHGYEHMEEPQQENHHHSGLRSPLLGGGSHDDEGSHHLHSPLLDRGGHSGPDRRQNTQPYGGAERRGLLRSPILGGGGGASGDFYYDEPDDEEPIDEDNPNVLRSPLLAAKRPVIDRPRVQTPPGSNAHGVPRPSAPPEAGLAAQAANPYANVQAAPASPAVQPTASGGAPAQIRPQGAPPAAAQSPVQAALQQLPQPTMQPLQAPTAQSIQQQAAPSAPLQPPTNVPAAFQNMQSGLPAAQSAGEPGSFAASVANSPGLGSAGLAQPPAAATPPVSNAVAPNMAPPPVVQDARPTIPPSSLTSATGAINVLPPKPGTTSSTSGLPTVEPNKSRAASKMLAGGYDDEQNLNEQPYSAGRFHAPAADARQQSPIFKIVGAIALVMFLAKCYTVMMFFGTDYKTVFFMVIDQLVGLVTLLCLMVVCFNAKS